VPAARFSFLVGLASALSTLPMSDSVLLLHCYISSKEREFSGKFRASILSENNLYGISLKSQKSFGHRRHLGRDSHPDQQIPGDSMRDILKNKGLA